MEITSKLLSEISLSNVDLKKIQEIENILLDSAKKGISKIEIKVPYSQAETLEKYFKDKGYSVFVFTEVTLTFQHIKKLIFKW